MYIQGGTFTLAGTSNVTDNTDNSDNDNNVYIKKDGKKITIGDSFTGLVGVTTAVKPTDTYVDAGSGETVEYTYIDVTGTNDTDYSAQFTSDDTLYRIINSSTNVVQLAAAYADNIYVTLEPITDADDNPIPGEYSLVLNGGENRSLIKNFTSAQLKFKLNSTNESGEDCDITSLSAITLTPSSGINMVTDNYNGGFALSVDEGSTITAENIILGTITINGVGKYSLGFDTDYDSNQVVCNSGDGILTYFVYDATATGASDEEEKLYLDTDENEIIPDSVNLTINVMFPNRVYSQTAAYTDMQVAVNNLVDTYFPDTEFDLGSDNTNVTYVTPDDGYDYYGYIMTTTIAAGYSTELTFTGSGYRKYQTSVRPDSGAKDVTVNVWNNPMDEATHPVITVDGVEDSDTETDITFLAGDIVNIGVIDLYDLSAVTSYFGYTAADDEKESPSESYIAQYLCHDLNRDGKIDSRDIAMVLVSWGK